MVAGVVAGNISPEATSPFGNIFADAMRGVSGYFTIGSSATHPVGIAIAGARHRQSGWKIN